MMLVSKLRQTLTIFACATILLAFAGSSFGQEVGKGKIPENQLASSFKTLPWGVDIWDTAEIVSVIKAKEKVLFVDTRPASFFSKGAIRGSVNLDYNIKGKDGTLTEETLLAAVEKAGMTKDDCKVVFFCQGPKCHRSYNATFVAVTEWGYKADNIIWNREGYPYLFKEVKANPKLKRKAKKYISDSGLSEM